MKINELFEALPGTQKQGWFGGLFGGNEQAKRIKASIDQGVKSWIAYAEQLRVQGIINASTPADTYAKIFKQWASRAANLNANHPALTDIETELATTLRGKSMKPIQNAVTKLVNLTQSMAANPEGRYTPQMKVQAVSKLIDQKYGKFIKNIATKQAIDKFIQDTMDTNTAFTADQLFKAAEAKVSSLVAPSNPTIPPNYQIPLGIAGTYKWTGNQWVNSANNQPAPPNIVTQLNQKAAQLLGSTNP